MCACVPFPMCVFVPVRVCVLCRETSLDVSALLLEV